MASKNFYTIDADDKLFAKCDGVTTTFVDSSTANPKTITANGNATQLSLHADFAGKRTAGFFNGTTDYVQIPASADFDWDGDFSISCYFFLNARPANGEHMVLVSRYKDANNYLFLSLYNNNSSTNLMPHFYGFVGGSNFNCSTNYAIGANQWYKLSVTRTGSTITYVLDGVSQVSGGTTSANLTFSSTALNIGYPVGSATKYLNGWMKNLTITKASSTVLDMRFDSPATSPLGPAIAFDGTGDYLSLADHSDWDLTDFTIEGFYRFDNVSSAKGLWGTQGTTDYNWTHLQWNNGTNTLELIVSRTSVNNSWTPVANKNYHIAVSRSSGTIRVFIDGVLQGTTGSDSDSLAPSNPIAFGIQDSNYHTGYIREIRISNTARYTSAFTPSQSGFTVDANTKLYIKGNENNGVTTFLDSSASPKTVTTVGDTKIKYTEDYRSCIFKDETGKFPYPVGSAKVDFFSAFGEGVGYFDGTNSYLSIPDDNDFDWGVPSGTTNDFVLEAYARHNDTGTGHLFARATTGKNALNVTWNTGAWEWDLNNSTIILSGVSAPYLLSLPANTWTHLALVRNGSTLSFYQNGTLVKSGSDSSNYTSSDVLWIGHNGSTYYKGLLDNIRISKGVARYTATFNPPEWKRGGNQIMWVI